MHIGVFVELLASVDGQLILEGLAQRERFTRVVAEAMAGGLPVVTCDDEIADRFEQPAGLRLGDRPSSLAARFSEGGVA